jgi:ABC-2 type transport system permease protein
MFKIFVRLWQIRWAEQWQYRASLMMYILYGIISPVVFLSVWRSIAQTQGQVGGLTANDFTIYYLVLLAVSNLTAEITIWILAYRIQDGTLSAELLKPVHPILTTNLVTNLANKALTVLVLAPVWVVVAFLFQADFSSVRPSGLLLGLVAVAVGFVINFLMGAAITCLAFWTTRVYSFSEFFYGVVLVFGGLFVPLDLLPAGAQAAARLLPFQLFLYFPVQLILGKMDSAQIWQNFALQGIWTVLLFLALTWVWKAGLKRFSAVGA